MLAAYYQEGEHGMETIFNELVNGAKIGLKEKMKAEYKYTIKTLYFFLKKVLKLTGDDRKIFDNNFDFYGEVHDMKDWVTV